MKTTILIFLLLIASVCCAELSDDVKVESIEVTKTIVPARVSAEEERVCISFKAQVVNEGNKGIIYIDLVAKNAVCMELNRKHLKGSFGEYQSQELTGSITMPVNVAEPIVTWEVLRIGKYSGD